MKKVLSKVSGTAMTLFHTSYIHFILFNPAEKRIIFIFQCRLSFQSMNLYKGLLFDLSYNHSNKFDDETVNTYLLNRTSSRPRSQLFHVGKPPTLFS